jgi:hypothetical protein
MPWRGAGYDGEFPSLGWTLVDFYEDSFIVPSGPDYGKPLHLTDEQVTFIVRLYQLHPVTGKRIYRRAGLRRPKGWGKSPLVAAWAGGELVGPVVFDGWDAAGEPVGRPQPTPWVQIAACSIDQTDNTYAPVYEMLSESPRVDDLGLDVGLTRVHLRDHPGRLEPVTASAGSREGQPVTAAALDEVQFWVDGNGGTRLAAVIRRNVSKMGGTTVETGNAFRPGAGSVGEATEQASRRGQAGLLYDSREGPEVKDLSDRQVLRASLEVAYGDSKWVP